MTNKLISFLSMIIFASFIGCGTINLKKYQKVTFTGDSKISVIFPNDKKIDLLSGSSSEQVERNSVYPIMVKCSAQTPSKEIYLQGNFNNWFIFGNLVIYIILYPTTLLLGPVVVIPWPYLFDLMTKEGFSYKDTINLDTYCQ